MKKILFAASAAIAAMTMASNASAALQLVGKDDIQILDSTWSDNFGVTVKTAGPGNAFSAVFTFDTTGFGELLADLSIISGVTSLNQKGDVDFTSVTLDSFVFDITPDQFNSTTGKYEDIASLGAVKLSEGLHTVTVTGFAVAPASLGGTINVSPVPEPATWAMMIAGVAAVGMSMRRRSSVSQVAFS